MGAMAILLAGTLGYGLGSRQLVSSAATTSLSGTDLEHFLPPASFSEVENARGVLQASLDQILMQVRIAAQIERRPGFSTGSNAWTDPDRPTGSLLQIQSQSSGQDSIVKTLKEAIHEFRGTAQEWVLREELLWLQKAGPDREGWIEMYLEALYIHPTHSLVGRFASDALRIAKGTAMESRVVDAMHHVLAVPSDFTSKRAVEMALTQHHMPLRPQHSPHDPVS